jgi:hypothetical protein
LLKDPADQAGRSVSCWSTAGQIQQAAALALIVSRWMRGLAPDGSSHALRGFLAQPRASPRRVRRPASGDADSTLGTPSGGT